MKVKIMQHSKRSMIIVCFLVAAMVFGYVPACSQNIKSSPNIPQPKLGKLKDLPVAPESQRVDIKSPTFSNPTKITHPLFPVKDRSQTILLGNVDGRPLQVTYMTLPESRNRTITWDGKKIETRTVQYVAHMDRRLVEYALDWYAQADDGSVWYFGEDVFNYDDGQVADTHGTWLAGKDGPPAMIMPADPKPGNVYRVENIPDIAFEEVEVKTVNATVEGPLGSVTGCMIGRQLHDNGSYSDKTFCPGIGEFFTAKGLDLETVAISVPTDALPGPLPAELANITAGALGIYDAAESGDWQTALDKFKTLQSSWNSLRGGGQVSTLLATQMDRALRYLEGDVLEPALLHKQAIGTRNGAIDVALASLDLELRYRQPSEVDGDRLAVFARKTLIDAKALEHGLVLSDVRTLELIRDRLRHTLEKAKSNRLDSLMKDMRTGADAEDFEKVSSGARHLLDAFKRP